MATLSPPESRRLYSWWWDSHNSPKNSKWLQDNLTDMDAKVKSMIKLIEEDADSFARRAEMYYKKRPELMKLVEEFYRAYRALAERYNHATGELRHAHHTIAKAFSDQVPIELVEDSPSKPFTQNRDLHTPETKFPVRRALFETYDLLEDTPHKESKCWLKKEKEKVVKESEVEDLKKSLSGVQDEKENALLKYQHCLAKLSDVEGELDCAQKDSMKFNEKVSRAEIEVQMLKEALVQLEAEKKAVIVKQKEYMEKISHLKTMVSQIQEENKGLNERAIQAESEVSRLELEKEVILQQYKQCLETISALENLISVIENEGSLLKKQAERAENEVSELERVLSDLNKEKETSAVQYKCCLEMITKLERDIASANEEIKRLNNDVLIGDRKISTAEEKCTVLETLNLSLKNEEANLLKKIGVRERELKEMEDELEKVRTSFHDEQLRHAKTEATLQSLQNLHSRSQDDQRALAIELKNVIRTLNDLEVSKCCLEEEIQEVREENKSLRETNLSSSSSMVNMQNEILTLMEINERLEREVKHQIEQSRFLQKEIMSLKGEIEGLKSLQDENIKLRERNEEGSCEREILSKKLENMQQLLNKKMVLEESSQFLCGEKAVIVSEKVSLLSQLETVTDNMHNLLEKNAVLESTLTAAKVEVEVLREKSNGLEEICELLKKETSYLLTERSALELKSENAERKLESLEKRYMRLKEKYTGLEKEKEAMHCQVEVLKFSLSMEKQERINLEMQNEIRLDGLENQIRFLKEENSWKKKEYEEELERSLKAQFEISILHKFIRDMEEKNCSLVIECQKHVEASKLAEKLISELESESVEQQVGADVLLDEVERLRLGIYEVFKAVEASFKCDPEGKIENEQTFLNHIVGVIEDMKCSLMKHEDEKERILVENLVLVTLLEQLKADGMEIKSRKMHLKKELNDACEKLSMAKNEKEKLVELYGKLELDVSESCEHAAILEAELKRVGIEQTDLQKSYGALEEAYVEVTRDNEDLLKKFSVLEEEKDQMTQLNDSALFECIATDSRSVILRSFCEEKVEGLKLLIKDLTRQQEINRSLESEMCVLQEKVELQNAENLVLKDDVCKLEGETKGMRESNVHMEREILRGKDSLLRTEEKLEAAENSNLELCRAVDELKMDVQELKQSKVNLENDILEFSEINSIQNKEIESLHIIKRHFEAEIGDIHEEMEERMLREQVSSIREVFFEKKVEELTVVCQTLENEVFFEKKVEELTVVCQTLENENTLKNSEIERMKREICSMGSEISGLKSQIYAYNPIIEALRDDIMFLEQNVLLQTKIRASENQESEFLEVSADRSTSSSGMLMEEEEEEDQSLVSLQNLQMRIKAVGKLIEEMKKPVFQRRLSSKSKQELPTSEIEHPTSQRCLGGEHSRKKVHGNEVSETPKLQRIKTKASESRNGVLMKDIPLDRASNSSLKKVIRRRSSGGGEDQMLELWETVEDGNRDLTIGESLRLSFKMTDKDIVYDGFECDNVKSFSSPPSTDSNMEKELRVDKWEVSNISTEHNREANSRRVLERLVSDAQKLENLRVTAHNLRSELETSKKGRKGKNVDYETVQEQLVEAEETVANLLVLNGRLVKNIEEWPSPPMKEGVKTRRRRVREEARKGSERIGRLQLEIQKIQYMLMKMEEEKKNKIRNKFLKSKSVILREFVYNRRKNSARRKKGPICGCFRPSTSRSGRST